MTTHKKTHKEQHNKTPKKTYSSKPKTPRTSVRLALPAFSALLTVLAVLVFGSALLALSCAPASVATQDFDGSPLSYAETTYEFGVGIGGTIAPDGTPAIPSADTRTSISYVLEIIDGTALVPEPGIDSGVITIDSATSAGTARYFVRAEATGYTTQRVMLTIIIINTDKLQVSTYYSNVATETLPVELGQAIADDSAFALADTDAILTISNLTDGNHSIHFGTAVDGGANDYSGGSYPIMVSNNTITILKPDLAANSFVFTDGAVIGISELDSTDIQHVATYYPSNIYGSHDLQAMRKNLARDYVLKQNIVFIPMTDDTDTAISNYEAVGDDSNPFMGSLDGASYTISGIQIEGTDTDNYQGLFGVMEASSVDIMAAQNLVLRDFKITANAYVGSLAGWIKKGTVDNVHVEVSDANADANANADADTGKVEASGSIAVGTDNYGYGGGLLGRAGADATDTQVKIQNTSSAVAVSGTGADSIQIGGLVGKVDKGVMLTESYATGSVTGTRSVGGLVGFNDGTVTGYATGSISGSFYLGGLVGFNNSSGTVTGYATGSISGSYYLGGLVGANVGTSIGYATGSVAGDNYSSGGLVGLMSKNSGSVSGYARGIVRRTGGTNLTFGKVVGQQIDETLIAIFSSSSMSESKVYEGETGTFALADVRGDDGSPVTVTGKDGTEVDIAGATEVTFQGLTFGTDIGQWTWVANGKWPAINIGDELKPAADQPVGPVDR